MTVQSPAAEPTLKEAAARLGVAVDALDATFGVVLTDPGSGLYSVRLPASCLPADRPSDANGPFSDPRIEPFGSV